MSSAATSGVRISACASLKLEYLLELLGKAELDRPRSSDDDDGTYAKSRRKQSDDKSIDCFSHINSTRPPSRCGLYQKHHPILTMIATRRLGAEKGRKWYEAYPFLQSLPYRGRLSVP